MSDHKTLAYVAREIVKLRQEQETFLAAGRVANFDEYRHVCGVIRGLNHAESIINDLVQRIEHDD